MSFKNQAEIWEYLLGDNLIAINDSKSGYYLKLKNGFVVDQNGERDFSSFDYPEDWKPYTEPKPKKVIEFFECVVFYSSGAELEWIVEEKITESISPKMVKTGQTRIVEVEE